MISLLAGIAIGIGTIVAIAHWDELVKWLKAWVSTLFEAFATVAKGIANAAAVFVQTVKEGFGNIMHRLFYKENGQWMEQTTTRVVPENQLPDWVKKKIGKQEVDMTDDFEQKLEMKIS